MSTTGIKPGQTIYLCERRGDLNHILHNGLVLGISMEPSLLGENGEPSIEAIALNPNNLRAVGTADWPNALTRFHNVVHRSHSQWVEGRNSISYEEASVQTSSDETMMTLIAARTVHEANRILCVLFGDYSQVPWDQTPEAIQNSALSGIEMLLANPGITPEQQHAGWMEYKIAEGWTWGPVKNMELKQHPCLVSYSQLPPQQQMKDFMFGAVARAIFGLLQMPLSWSGDKVEQAPIQQSSNMQNTAMPPTETGKTDASQIEVEETAQPTEDLATAGGR